jgi:hypothetical protein
MLAEVPDPRRAEGMLYKLPYVLLFAILAKVSNRRRRVSQKTIVLRDIAQRRRPVKRIHIPGCR